MSYCANRIAARRKAVVMLKQAYERASKRSDYAAADAMSISWHDTEIALREDAAYLIDEGTRMRWAHEADSSARSAA